MQATVQRRVRRQQKLERKGANKTNRKGETQWYISLNFNNLYYECEREGACKSLLDSQRFITRISSHYEREFMEDNLELFIFI